MAQTLIWQNSLQIFVELYREKIAMEWYEPTLQRLMNSLQVLNDDAP